MPLALIENLAAWPVGPQLLDAPKVLQFRVAPERREGSGVSEMQTGGSWRNGLGIFGGLEGLGRDCSTSGSFCNQNENDCRVPLAFGKHVGLGLGPPGPAPGPLTARWRRHRWHCSGGATPHGPRAPRCSGWGGWGHRSNQMTCLLSQSMARTPKALLHKPLEQ